MASAPAKYGKVIHAPAEFLKFGEGASKTFGFSKHFAIAMTLGIGFSVLWKVGSLREGPSPTGGHRPIAMEDGGHGRGRGARQRPRGHAWLPWPGLILGRGGGAPPCLGAMGRGVGGGGGHIGGPTDYNGAGGACCRGCSHRGDVTTGAPRGGAHGGTAGRRTEPGRSSGVGGRRRNPRGGDGRRWQRLLWAAAVVLPDQRRAYHGLPGENAAARRTGGRGRRCPRMPQCQPSERSIALHRPLTAPHRRRDGPVLPLLLLPCTCSLRSTTGTTSASSLNTTLTWPRRRPPRTRPGKRPSRRSSRRWRRSCWVEGVGRSSAGRLEGGKGRGGSGGWAGPGRGPPGGSPRRSRGTGRAALGRGVACRAGSCWVAGRAAPYWVALGGMLHKVRPGPAEATRWARLPRGLEGWMVARIFRPLKELGLPA